MKRVALGVALGLVAVTGLAADPSVVRSLAVQLRTERALLEAKTARLARALGSCEEAQQKVNQLAADFARAVRDGESAESLGLRDGDLRLAESQLLLCIGEVQRLREALLEGKERVAALGQALAAARSAGGTRPDPITGRWQLVIEPGGNEGTADLRLEGTLITGTYELAGGWYGSFKGTLVQGKVRLERIDSRLGFAAVFYGSLDPGEPPHLAGTWEGTNLAAGLPAGGSWYAERLPAEEGEAHAAGE